MSSECEEPVAPVADGESLYRAVYGASVVLATDADGLRRISGSAFNDRRRRPSVDRAAMCPDGPANTQARFGPGTGVLSVVAGDVRSISVCHGTTGAVYAVDVEAVPEHDSPAHAEIFGQPPFDTDRIFDRIKQALARLAEVVIEPE